MRCPRLRRRRVARDVVKDRMLLRGPPMFLILCCLLHLPACDTDRGVPVWALLATAAGADSRNLQLQRSERGLARSTLNTSGISSGSPSAELLASFCTPLRRGRNRAAPCRQFVRTIRITCSWCCSLFIVFLLWLPARLIEITDQSSCR